MRNFLITLCVFIPMQSFASSPAQQFMKAYADHALVQYSQALVAARDLQKALLAFTQNPSDATQQAAKDAWTVSRTAYSPSEAYRFALGPIDDANGPEPLLNSWPVDESTIDYVEGHPEMGIINNPKLYPTINAKLLLALNAKAGEDAITIGYHAVEFLLWGQDLNIDAQGNPDFSSAGKRTFEDYVVGGKVPNADRRAQYLNVVGALMVTHLQYMVDKWTPKKVGNYVDGFLRMSPMKAIPQIIESLAKLSGEELAHERMYVAIDTGDQEEEHSCFSDQTLNDFKYDFLGIKIILQDMPTGIGLISLIKTFDPDIAQEFVADPTYSTDPALAKDPTNMRKAGAIIKTENAIAEIPFPFDLAIQDPNGPGVAATKNAISELENVMNTLRKAEDELKPGGGAKI